MVQRVMARGIEGAAIFRDEKGGRLVGRYVAMARGIDGRVALRSVYPREFDAAPSAQRTKGSGSTAGIRPLRKSFGFRVTIRSAPTASAAA